MSPLSYFGHNHGTYLYMGADKSLARPGQKTSYIPRILWNLEVHYHIHKSPPPVPTVAKSIHSSAHHTFDRRSLFSFRSG